MAPAGADTRAKRPAEICAVRRRIATRTFAIIVRWQRARRTVSIAPAALRASVARLAAAGRTGNVDSTSSTGAG
jgi:hypothetical protein